MQKRVSSLVLTVTAVCALAAGLPDDWPRWRGPSENGVARGDAPLKWSDSEHISWKVEVPGRGNSSPVLWGDRIFLTTAVPTGKPAAEPTAASAATPPDAPPPGGRPPGGPGGGERGGGRRGGGGYNSAAMRPQAEQKFLVLAFDRKTGKRLWEQVARVAAPHEGFHSQYGSFASPSMLVDSKHAIAFFGSRGLYCYTHDGQKVWEKDFGIQMRMPMAFGEGGSPALDGERLVVLFDQEGESFLTALDKSSGRELWRTPRPSGTGWSSPLIATVNGRKQVIVAATKFSGGYDLETGKLLWKIVGLGRNVIPMPVVADGIVYLMSGYQSPNLMAVKLGGEGELPADAILWQNQRGNSYTPSPVLADGKLYVLADNGMLSCFDARTGKAFYQQQRLPKSYSFKASPVAAGGKLYLATEDGDVVVVKMGEQFEVLATNSLADQRFIATPAVVDGAIYLRGQNTLFCVR
jgi:outer membrane protein assembly factor BamB